MNDCKYNILNLTAAVIPHTYTCIHRDNLLGFVQSVQSIAYSLEHPRDYVAVCSMLTEFTSS